MALLVLADKGNEIGIWEVETWNRTWNTLSRSVFMELVFDRCFNSCETHKLCLLKQLSQSVLGEHVSFCEEWWLILCWVRAASGPFSGEQFIRTSRGFLSMGWNGSKSGFLGTKVGEKWVETHFSPTSTPFRDFRENPLFSQFKGGGNCFLKRALKQSRPIIRLIGETGMMKH